VGKKRKLTPKQKLFVKEYLIDLNATQAAIRAGYSEKTAYRTGADNLKKPQIQAELEKAMKAREKRTEITQDRVLKELAKIGFADIKDFLSYRTEKTVVDVDADGTEIIGYQQIINAKSSDEVDGTVISEVSLARDGTFKFKLQDKIKALEMMCKHLGMFIDKREISGNINVNNPLEGLTTEEIRQLIADED
jgi:phage terminase small subunit